MKRVASTLHQVIKLATHMDENTLYIDQIEAKQCYLSMVSTKAAIKEVQFVKEEGKVKRHCRGPRR